jgi:hypothetical protein
MKIAVCTLVVGKRFEKLFEEFCLRSWENYCRSHHYELFVFRKPFALLVGKSFAWQKLLLLEQPDLAGFDKIIWLDADIIITRDAPPIEVPVGKLGYVLETPFTGSIESWYRLFSLPPAREIVQTGVLALEAAHRPILRQALAYPETGMYEMPALSWCISQADVGYHLDRRFNALLGTLMLDYAPRWIVTNKLVKETLWQLHYPPLRRAVADVCKRSWFIHAAGAKRDLLKAGRYLAHLEASNSQSAPRSP